MRKTAVLALARALAAPASAASVEPERAAVGERITVVGPPGAVELVPIDVAGPPRPLGRIGSDGTLTVRVPEVPHGRYRVVAAGDSEAPVLEVLPLSQETSLALFAFGALLVVALAVAGIVVHRRWRDAIS
jgi:hypothetical protein